LRRRRLMVARTSSSCRRKYRSCPEPPGGAGSPARYRPVQIPAPPICRLRMVRRLCATGGDRGFGEAVKGSQIMNAGGGQLGSCLTDATHEARSRRSVRVRPLRQRPNACADIHGGIRAGGVTQALLVHFAITSKNEGHRCALT
jgi:hypothetical protein